MTTRTSQIFISYQRADEPFARQLREHLVVHGMTTWMDQHDIPVGAYWPDEIDRGLAASDIVVGILSPDAVESRNVKNEWDWAIQNDRRLVLMQVAPCLIPHRYVSINFIDATGPDISTALASLVRSVGAGTPDDQVADPSQAPPTPTRHAARIPLPTSRPVPFIAGREREQAILRAQLDQLVNGQGSLVLIGGEAGIGKTTLTNWLAAEADARGAVVLAGGCYDLTTTPPYGPWGEIVRSWPDDRGLPPVPDALRGGEAMARLQSQAALFELAADLLATAGMVRPLVVLLEDLHWADQPSLDLLRYLVRLVSGFRMMLVATYRDDEITRRHALFQLLPALAREPGAERISLSRLGTEAVGQIIATRYAVDASDRDRLTDYVLQATEGNPFFASEILRALEEANTLTQEDIGWRVGDLAHIGVPELVRQVIEGRLTRLGENAHRLLQIASVVGHEVPVDLWVEVSGMDEALLSEALDRATEARIIEELPRGDGFRFTHALIRETLYEGLGLLHRRTLHRKTGETMAAGPRPDADAVAHHFSQAGDQRAFDWLLQAAARANGSYAWLVAAERYEQAAALIADDPDRRRVYGFVLVSAATMRRYSDPQLAVRHMEEAARIGSQIDDAWLATFPRHLAGYYRLMNGQMRTGVNQMVAVGPDLEAIFRDGRMAAWAPPPVVDATEWPAFELILRLTLQAAVAHPDHPVVSGRGLTASHLAQTGRFRDARELAEQLAVVWPPQLLTSHGVTLAAVARYGFPAIYMALALVYHAMGEPQQALESARVALGACEEIAHHFVAAMCHESIVKTLIAYRTDDIEQRRDATNAAADAISRAQSVLPSNAPVHLARLSQAIVEGGWKPISAGLRDQISGVMPTISISKQLAAAGYATIATCQGRYDEARQVIQSMLPGGPRTEPGDHEFQSATELQRAAVSLVLADGDPETAREWIECYDRWMAWSGAVLGQAEGHLCWARYYRQAGDLAAAEEQARTALAKASEPRQPLCLIASHRLLGELATERGAYGDACGHLDQALTLAGACAAPYERALTLIALAALDIAIGADAGEKLAEARAICERLEARPALDRIATLEQRLAGRGTHSEA